MGADEFRISYGRGHLSLALPAAARATVIRKMTLPKLADPAQAIASTFERPVGSAPLAELARDRRSACILICDITRPVPNRLFLRPMIETLTASGVPRDRISILVATGLHRPNSATSSPNWSATPGCSNACGSKTTTRARTTTTSTSAARGRAELP